MLSNEQWERIAPELPGKVGDPGATARDNRLFVEAVLWIARTGAPWRDLPRQFGNWFTVYTRSGDGHKRALGSEFSSVCRMIPILNMYSSMRRNPGPSARNRRKRGTEKQAIGKSRGGRTTKIAAVVDALGYLIRFVLLPGNRHDITSFDALLAGIYSLALIGDKAFDAL